MCPPASIPSAVELDEYSTEEVVIKSLTQIKSGCSLPGNVLSEVNPYQFIPSNLPANVWYLWSGTQTEAENSFWRSTGEACEIYSTSAIVGLRKTLQYFESPTPDGKRTNWMMQEYTTTEKQSSNSKPDSRALYRVFMVDESNSGSGRLSKSELLEKNFGHAAGPSAMANQSPNLLSAVADRSPDPLGDYLLRGDYLELNDLDIPLSRTTSSADSSCMTMSMTSEDFFDSDALLLELGNDTVDQEIKGSRIKLNLTAPPNSKEVVMQPATSESLKSVEESKPLGGQTSKMDPTPENKPGDHGNENTSSKDETSASSSSSSSSEGSSKEEKKDRVNRAKRRKMIKYLCFLAF